MKGKTFYTPFYMNRYSLAKTRLFGQKILDFLLPPHCLLSGEVVDQQGMIAPHKWIDIHFIERPFCHCCGFPFPHDAPDTLLCSSCVHDHPLYQTCRSALVYNADSKALILRLKYGDRLEIAPLLATWLERAGAELLPEADFLIPVPLHFFRRIKRKYNQSAILARHLSDKCGVPVKDGVLKRTRHTPAQSGDKKSRRRNVAQAFVIDEKHRSLIKGKTIILIDDVYTTGSTVNECAKTLLNHGAKAVNVLTVARIVYHL